VAGTLAGLVVFGLFPAAVAATTVLARMRIGAAGAHHVRDFTTVYRSQFLHANRVGSLFWLAGVVLFLNFLTVLGPADTTALSSPVPSVLLLLSALAGLGTLAGAATAVAVCSRYRDTVIRTWRTAFLLPLVSVVAFAVVFSGMSVLVPLVGASVPLLVSGRLVGRRLAGLEAAEPAVA
jgi:uncharacterized membrane protein YesL